MNDLDRMRERYPIRLWETDGDLFEEPAPLLFPVCPDCGRSTCSPYCESEHS
jgi:hypothetical protein